MPVKLPEPTLDLDLRDALLATVAARHEGAPDPGGLGKLPGVGELVRALGVLGQPHWLAAESEINDLVAAVGEVNFTAGYVAGMAAGAAGARVGRTVDPVVAALAERVVVAVIASGLPLDDALNAAEAALAVLRATPGGRAENPSP
jgi:hypothetical protein